MAGDLERDWDRRTGRFAGEPERVVFIFAGDAFIVFLVRDRPGKVEMLRY